MANNNGISTKEHLEAIFKEFKERYSSDQKAQDDRFEDFKKTLDKEGKLLAEKYKSDLIEYPNIEDFNKLQEKVTIEFSSAMTKARLVPIIISILALIIAAISITAPWWTIPR